MAKTTNPRNKGFTYQIPICVYNVFALKTDISHSITCIISKAAPAKRSPGLLPAMAGDTYSPPDHSVTVALAQISNHKKNWNRINPNSRQNISSKQIHY